MSAPLLRCRDLRCRRPLWREGASRVRGISADFMPGRFHAILGPEGCGKNLLLHILGLLEQPDSGDVWLGETNAAKMEQSARDMLRQRCFGFLFPASALLPSMSILENIAFSVLKAGDSDEDQQAEKTLAALQFCGLENDADRPAASLDPERLATVAFARAIVHRPAVLIAESPASGDTIIPLARRAVDELSLTVIWGGRPDGSARDVADRILVMEDGLLCGPGE